jgi:DNA-binding CsgD family transcriptional regulator
MVGKTYVKPMSNIYLIKKYNKTRTEAYINLVAQLTKHDNENAESLGISIK